VLYVRARSAAARDADELTSRYAEALGTVSAVLGIDADALPTIIVYLSDLPFDELPASDRAKVGRTPVEAAPRSQLTIRTTYGDESPSTEAEVELARALLEFSYGADKPSARFWREGLSGHIAARSGRRSHYTDAEAHCRKLLEDGALPLLSELVAESSSRVSAIGSTAACAFTGFLIDRYGQQRYRRLLRATHSGATEGFDAIYPSKLTIVDRDWRRHLESTGSDADSSIWPTLRRLYPIARPYWRAGLAVLACSLVGVGFSLAMPLSFRFLIDNILGQRPLSQSVPFVGPKGHVISNGQEQIDVLILLLTMLGCLYVLNAAARLVMNLMLVVVGEAFTFDLRRRMLGIMERLPASYYAGCAPADITERVVQDVETVQGVIVRAAVPIFAGIISVICFTALLFVLEPKLAAITVVGLPIVALIHAVRRKGRRAAARERIRRMSELSAGVSEAASAHVLAKLHQAGSYLTNRLVRRMETHRQLNTAYARENAFLAQSGTLVLGLIQIAVLLVGGYLIVVSDGQDLAPGSLVAFYIVLNQLLGPIGQVSTSSQAVAAASASVERAASLLEAPTEQDRPDAQDVGRLRHEIRFDGVSYAYPDGKRALNGLTLTIKAGQTVAFVGPSGAGKSSIVQLLPRLFEPTRGSITWDGIDLRKSTLRSLRRQIGMVQQEPLLLNASIHDNIRFGFDDGRDDALHRAASVAAADEVIRQLPRGYDTVVGQGGVGLSGGQRQRIAVARAIVHSPSLLILDEATSALDATMQRTVQQRLREAGDSLTIVKVAHRLETVVDADVIFVLDDGRLVEQGSHAELLASGGLYARLVADQTSPFQSASKPAVGLAVHRLQDRPPFSRLSAEDLELLSGQLESIEAEAGRELYHHGDPADSLYVLVRGRVELRFPGDGRHEIVKEVEPGALVGDQSFLIGRARPADARVVSNALLYRLSREAWEAFGQRSNRA
jgi:ABC-type multidrug transport system fused ATPase/permease subunit